MALALLICGAAFGALCVWLTVRIINRREPWAKWALGATIGVPLLYVLSFGPACNLASRQALSRQQIRVAYKPVLFVAWNARWQVGDIIVGYVDCCGGAETIMSIFDQYVAEELGISETLARESRLTPL
jgi:hypothetical protein